MKFEKEILLALEVSTSENPKEMWELVYVIDFYQREVPSYDEMRAVMQSMIEKGIIREKTKFQYYKTKKNETKGTFTEFSQPEYSEAVEKYREWLEDEWDRADNIPMEKVIVVELEKKYRENKELYDRFTGYLADDFIQINCSGIPVGVNHSEDSLIIELTSIESIDPQELYKDYVLPLIEDVVEKYGGAIKVSVGRNGESKKEHII